MTDQIPADKVREILANRDLRAAEMIAEIESILPPRPTLADMPWVERAACRWMQCDVKKSRKRHVIVNACDCHGKVELVSEEGEFRWEYPNRVTPRPDLPRLEWPGNQKPGPALPDGWRLADHQKHGRVIVTNSTPDTEGDVYFVAPDPDPMGYDWLFCRPDELTYIDQEADQ